MKRNSRSHLMGNRRWREEKEEFKIKTQFHSSHKMTYTCVEAYIIDTGTWDSCHVLAGKTPGICLEGKILIRRIISALSTGEKKTTNKSATAEFWLNLWKFLFPQRTACCPCCLMPQTPQWSSLWRPFTAGLRAGAGQNQLSHYLSLLGGMPSPRGLTLLRCINHRRASVDVCAWEKTPPQWNLLHFVSQIAKPDPTQCFAKSPSTISQIKIKQGFGTSLCSRFTSVGISSLHLNRTERLQWSFRKMLETTGWCVLVLWKMISLLIPGTVFISNPSYILNFANRCTNADLNTTEISNSLHM